MKKNILFALGLSTSLFAATCNYTVDSSSLQWTAFKTPAKVGVKGTFDNVKLDFKISDSKEALLKSSSINIVTANVNSNNQGRDAKLVNSFFMVQGIRTIKAKVIKVDKTSADIEIAMNNIKKIITMNLITTKNTIKLQGEIDLADFKMLPSLNAITKACYELHQGKTWQDVALEFNITTSCK
ncbi:YceI family protein [Sulfurimonas sp. C5]|uniref:YceI family protein n=1 Tax=Sulfurimonas sp. C5 TaxID=3036947 RepID=UPI002455AC7C|nr:YceI family protein [Sulfurimonas sp. C5]MDH4944941.1 YceI family protein [Sulfurimonas sp. C5]